MYVMLKCTHLQVVMISGRTILSLISWLTLGHPFECCCVDRCGMNCWREILLLGFFEHGLHLASAHRLVESCMVALVLVGVGDRKFS